MTSSSSPVPHIDPAASAPAGTPAPASAAVSGDARAADATSLPATERWRRALGALAKVVADPDRTDQVLEFGIYANAGTMKSRIHRFYDDPRGRRLYEERRTLDSKTVDLDALGRLPVGTLGRAYADFMRSRGITPEVFDGAPVQVADPRIAYVVQRIRQTHDLWHVVTGYETDASSEVVLQAFTFAQVQAPSSAIIALAGTLRGLRARPALPRDVIAAFRAGRRAERLATFLWEDHWETPLATVREMLGIRALARAAA
ncbi:MAG TPA: Coq4 family protein [Kofleriaceae bacterium]|nr:Coq4 family protein [Kofleriaceae bacterium]